MRETFDQYRHGDSNRIFDARRRTSWPFDALAAAFRLGGGWIVVAERSRLAREERIAYDALHLLKSSGLAVRYADGSNAQDESARVVDDIGHVITAHARRRIIARLKAGRDAKEARHDQGARAQGGRLPLGYRRDARGLVEINPETAEQLPKIFARVREGKSIREVPMRR